MLAPIRAGGVEVPSLTKSALGSCPASCKGAWKQRKGSTCLGGQDAPDGFRTALATASCAATAAAVVRWRCARKQTSTCRRVLQPFAIEPINANMSEMKATVEKLVAPGRRIFDSSDCTADVVLDNLENSGVDATEDDCIDWRQTLYTTTGLNEYCNAVILPYDAVDPSRYPERTLVDDIMEKDVVVGVRLDQGTFPLNGYGERASDGLAGLERRCKDYYDIGVRFAKWRTIVECNMELPTDVGLWENVARLTECARICQDNGLVLVVEMAVTRRRGNHSVERTAYVCEKAYSQAVRQMNEEDVNLEAVIFMPSICFPGAEGPPAPMDIIADFTARSLWRTLPPAVGGVHLHTGDMDPAQAQQHCDAIRQAIPGAAAPWQVAPVYGSASWIPALKAWAASDNDAKQLREMLIGSFQGQDLEALQLRQTLLEGGF